MIWYDVYIQILMYKIRFVYASFFWFFFFFFVFSIVEPTNLIP